MRYEEAVIYITEEEVLCIEELMLEDWETEDDPDVECLIIESISWREHKYPEDAKEWDVWLSSAQVEYFWPWLSDTRTRLWRDVYETKESLKNKDKYVEEEDLEEFEEQLEIVEGLLRKLHKFFHPYYAISGLHYEFETWNEHNMKDGNGVMYTAIYAMRHERDETKKWVVVYDLDHKEIFHLGSPPENLKEIIDATTEKYKR